MFNYYISELGGEGGSKWPLTCLQGGWEGGQNFGKPAYVILEQSPTASVEIDGLQVTPVQIYGSSSSVLSQILSLSRQGQGKPCKGTEYIIDH